MSLFLFQLFAVATLLCGAVSSAEINTCNISTAKNETVTLKYLANNAAGNVTVSLNDEPRVVMLSLCSPSDLACGATGYLVLLDENGGCGHGSVTYDVAQSSGFSYNASSASVVMELMASSNGATAKIAIQCDPSADRLLTSTEPVTVLRSAERFFAFASRTVCPDYAPAKGDDMLSRGAIVGIIIGFVAVVVIVSAVFQWRSRSSSGDAYQSI
jgi:hypothetical protein